VARHWAKTRHFKIAEQGEEAAYRLGLQTQAPMKKILWCTGPSRTFHVSNATVEVKHVSKGKLRWLNKPEGILFRGLSILNAKLVNIEQLTTAFSRLNLSSSQIETALRKLKAELSSEWTGKLNQLSGGMR
jgi:hypothetical protein